MKNRRRNVVFLLFIMFVVLLVGCSTSKTAVESQSNLQTEIADKPIIWKQSYFKTISLRDSVLFYNSSEIRLEGSFFNQSFFVRDGVVNVIDSINNVSKVVPRLTAGGLIDFKKNSSGEIVIMLISFSKNEAIYRFSFFRIDDGTFILNGKAELIFNGRKYPIVASTVGDCNLLFNYNKQQIINKTEGSAEGWKQSY